MLHLDARVDLDEINFLSVHIVEKLHGAGIAVLDRRHQRQRRPVKLCAQRSGHGDTGRFFKNFLVAALDRTITLAKMQHPSTAITKHLYFHMSRILHIALHVQSAIAKSLARFGAGLLKAGIDVRRTLRDKHPASTPAGGGFHQHRITQGIRCGTRLFGIRQTFGAGHQRHASSARQGFGGQFVAKCGDGFGAWPDEANTVFCAQAGQRGALRQKTIAGMQRIAAGRKRRVDQQVGI